MCGTFVFDNLHKQCILEVTIAEAGGGRRSNLISHLSLLNFIFFHDHFYLHMSLFKSFLPNTKLSVCFLGDCQKAGMDGVTVWSFLHFCAS